MLMITSAHRYVLPLNVCDTVLAPRAEVSGPPPQLFLVLSSLRLFSRIHPFNTHIPRRAEQILHTVLGLDHQKHGLCSDTAFPCQCCKHSATRHMFILSLFWQLEIQSQGQEGHTFARVCSGGHSGTLPVFKALSFPQQHRANLCHHPYMAPFQCLCFPSFQMSALSLGFGLPKIQGENISRSLAKCQLIPKKTTFRAPGECVLGVSI